MEKNRKSIAGNFYYLFHELFLFKSSSIFLPLTGSIFQILLSLITIWIPKIILDLIENKTDLINLFFWTIITGGALLIVSAVNAVVHNKIDSCSQVFLFTRLKAKWEEKMIDLDYEEFTSYAGKICAERARNAVDSPNFGVVTYMRRVTELLECLGGFLALSAIIFMLHPLILILLFILFGIELWYGRLAEARKYLLQGERAKVNRKLNYIAYNTRGIKEAKDIRIYSMAPWLRSIAKEAVAAKDTVEEKTARCDLKKMLLNGLLIFLRNGGAYAYLIYQYFYDSMTIGDFTLYFSVITSLGTFLSRLTQGYANFMEANNYVTDFRKFMELGVGKELKKYGTDKLDSPISFTWDNVSFSYQQTNDKGHNIEIPVLKGINLTIKAGEKLAVVGENGAGKTTFVKLLCGLLKPKEGRIFVNNINLTDFKSEDYRNLFSAVFQKSGVLPVSIRDNIVLNENKSSEETLWNCIRLANLEERVRSLPEGLDTDLVKRIAEHGTELSGGELQRLLLARALYKDAPVLILDEPTAALDPIAENEIYQTYNKLTKGKTAVFISHRLASTRFCDRILVMDNGEIAEIGTHEELMARKGKYAEMFAVQSKYYMSSGHDSLRGMRMARR